MAMLTGSGWSTPTRITSPFPAPAFSSIRRATSSLAPFFTRLPMASSVALRVKRFRFSPRASGTMRPSQTSSLILRRRMPETPAEAGRTMARARAPFSISPGKLRRPRVAISSLTSVMGISKRRSGLSEPYRSMASEYSIRGKGRSTSTPMRRTRRWNSGSMRS